MNDKQMCLNMVIGYPLHHTQSPQLHNAVYKALNLNAVLLAFPHKNIESLVQAIRTLSVGLTAVTMPFKEKIIPYIDYCSEEVNAIQSANTIIQRDGKLYGFNTDLDGIAYALRGISIAKKRVLIIGAGGAARAVGYFMQKNEASLFWLNRTPSKAMQLADCFGGELIDREQLKNMDIDILVNTTSLGMHADTHISPLMEYAFQPHQVVFDVIYNPVKTVLLQQAEQNGARSISGLDMFIGQGLRQIELWSGTTIDREKVGRLL